MKGRLGIHIQRKNISKTRRGMIEIGGFLPSILSKLPIVQTWVRAHIKENGMKLYKAEVECIGQVEIHFLVSDGRYPEHRAYCR